MNIRPFYKTVIIAIVLLSTVQAVQAQKLTRTGTNLNSNSIPSEVLMLEVPNEVERIRGLLSEGRKEEALKASEDFIEQIDRITMSHEAARKYYAWNAYCTVLTSLQRVEEAISACNTAIDLAPEKWSAMNNRGTAKYVGGLLDEALTDYQAALSMVDEKNSRVRDTIMHNISLVEGRR